MAYLDKRKRTYKSGVKINYYTRVNAVQEGKGYILIPLNTTDYDDALDRHEEVCHSLSPR